jgi:hypothetical protein
MVIVGFKMNICHIDIATVVALSSSMIVDVGFVVGEIH